MGMDNVGNPKINPTRGGYIVPPEVARELQAWARAGFEIRQTADGAWYAVSQDKVHQDMLSQTVRLRMEVHPDSLYSDEERNALLIAGEQSASWRGWWIIWVLAIAAVIAICVAAACGGFPL